MLKYSPWPLILSLRLPLIMLILVRVIIINFSPIIFFYSTTIVFVMTVWWRDASREAETGQHSNEIYTILQIGIVMLITSEVLFFFCFFWSFFWYNLLTNAAAGISWPPIGVTLANPYETPALNRVILLSSSVTVTWAHHMITVEEHSEIIKRIILTIILALTFLTLQTYEYIKSNFSISDSRYGAIFFIITGFHGAHVLAGKTMLIVATKRIKIGKLNKKILNNLEIAIWYWHFVDVVWLFLFVWLYWIP